MIEQLEQGILLPPQKAARFDDRRAVIRRAQILKQLRKLHDVTEVRALPHSDTVFRELLLIKVRNDAQTRQEILAAVDIFRSKIVDYATDALCIELTGESSKIDAFIELLTPFGILEMCRTGIVALERGRNCLKGEGLL